MRQYIVYRLGSNAANQHMCPRAAIGVVEARNPREASLAATDQYGRECYANQTLTVKAAMRCSAADWDDACSADEWRRKERNEQ